MTIPTFLTKKRYLFPLAFLSGFVFGFLQDLVGFIAGAH